MEKKVKNFKELHEILNEFRGHSNKKWDLVPKAGRSPYKKYNDKETFYE
ncbi:hypothetical protein [Mammaliicoccus sciuri]